MAGKQGTSSILINSHQFSSNLVHRRRFSSIIIKSLAQEVGHQGDVEARDADASVLGTDCVDAGTHDGFSIPPPFEGRSDVRHFFAKIGTYRGISLASQVSLETSFMGVLWNEERSSERTGNECSNKPHQISCHLKGAY
ncbi:MAG: hypothetical protein VXU50_01165 [Verrucomicrobiota bacterium]|jgi:hypothetical protein|nr:hypothetical protein [Verrucomicrobiota bacterium]